MQYLVLFLLFGLFAAAVFLTVRRFVMMKRLFLRQIIGKKIMGAAFFSTSAVNELADFILRQKCSRRKELLDLAVKGNFKILAQKLDNGCLRDKLCLMMSGKINRSAAGDALYYLMQCGFFWEYHCHEAARAALYKTKAFKLNRECRALQFLNTAKLALFEGDLHTASVEAAAALNFFQKHRFLFEEASVYFLQGTIYRVAGIFDTAELMLRSALKLFRALSADRYEAETLGTLGLLMAAQDRFSEAFDYMLRAEEIYSRIKDSENGCFILSQKAMILLRQNKIKEAAALARRAAAGHQTPGGQALAAEVLARTELAGGKWRSAAQKAVDAADKYFSEHNFAAGFESLYLAAEANFRQQDFNEAETILRGIIRKVPYHQSCFHIADAYTLLGLILLQTGKIGRARTIFNQALKHELSDNRSAGIAVDYANLAVAEKQCGNISAARKNLEAALAYAKDADNELYERIRAVLD